MPGGSRASSSRAERRCMPPSGTTSSPTTSNCTWLRRRSGIAASRSTLAHSRRLRCSTGMSRRSGRMSSSKAMFTGLIEAVGHVARIAPSASGLRIGIRTSLAAELSDGESVAVNGVCLTVVEREAGLFHADVGPETVRVTALGSLTPERPVNLERAMRPDGRLGGHFVQGHVDGIGTVREVREDGDAHWLKVAFSPALAPFFIPKGSVALEGVSLTVARLDDDQFDVMIIPFTWAHTSLAALHVGAAVNLECDMIGKY